MQDSGSHGESQGDHNYVARRTRSTSSDDSSIEFRYPGRRRTRLRHGRVENTDHDYIALRGISEDDDGGDIETEAEPSAEQSEDTQRDVDDDNNTDADDEAANDLAEVEQEMLGVGPPQGQNAGNETEDNGNLLEPAPPDPMAGPSVPTEAAGTIEANIEGSAVNLVSPSPPKKRKRLSLGTSKSTTPRVKSSAGSGGEGDEEDEGMTCPICLDNWEMSGEHRLVSLRCGHLFGDSCIRRWLTESARQSGIKACPQCKAKATNRDIRCLYAKRLRAIDRSEEHRLRDELEAERRRSQSLQTEVAALKMTNKVVAMQLESMSADNERMKQLLRAGGGGSGSFSYEADLANGKQLLRLQMHRLHLETTITITREPGCRVIIHAARQSSILASQKSAQGLFPGYGVRFIDMATFRATTFLHASTKLLRDMCLNADQQLLAVASMETRSKLFDLRTRQVVSIFEPGEKTLWACAMDRKDRENVLYLGSSNGSTYTYDIRFSDNILEEYKTEGDFSTVINVASVFPGSHFPNGGFLVCKLQSLWFYEYTDGSTTTIATRLNVEGPFSSMHYDAAQETLLVSARCSVRHPQSRYIVGRLEKVDDTPLINVKVTFHGSKATPIMTRCAQVAVEANTLVAGYIQDVKQLALFDVRREQRVQTMPAQEVIYDICAVYVNNATYLAGLSETKCRMYKLTSSNT
ncbi:E3 ubiquitin-protein ligase RFWD3 [Rhagoletis pomonella]|uniref:E3 ubiquitin-protein ligase RFWD3 n=1 Tax=Rhagoletis pomonella TaxID=28610 RepID=UPI001782F858|nr:E3 ubiquitin-protein ligase RFWD3 [Rhagoletis pomonella]